MNNRELILTEYGNSTKNLSNISRLIIGVISILQLYLVLTLSTILLVFWFIDILQYVFLAVKAELLMRDKISISTSNKVRPIATVLFYTKILIVLWVLIQLGGII